MRKWIYAGCLLAALVSCNKETSSWEYKVIKVAGQDAEYRADFGAKVYGDQTPMLNKMGKEGWELVDAYTEVGTEFPNFGDSQYVTGIRENVRTTVLNFVFKRPGDQQKDGQQSKSKKK